jgi:hypothetical protein
MASRDGDRIRRNLTSYRKAISSCWEALSRHLGTQKPRCNDASRPPSPQDCPRYFFRIPPGPVRLVQTVTRQSDRLRQTQALPFIGQCGGNLLKILIRVVVPSVSPRGIGFGRESAHVFEEPLRLPPEYSHRS